MPTSCNSPPTPCTHKQLIIINLKGADKLGARSDKAFYSIFKCDDRVLIIEHMKK